MVLSEKGPKPKQTTEEKSAALRKIYLRRLKQVNADPYTIGEFMIALDKYADEVDALAFQHEKRLNRIWGTSFFFPLSLLSLTNSFYTNEVKSYWQNLKSVFEKDRESYPPERWQTFWTRLTTACQLLEKRELDAIKPLPPS